MRRLQKAGSLAFGDWVLLSEAWVLLMAMAPALRVVPLRRLVVILGRVGSPKARTGSGDGLERTAYLVRVARSLVPFKPTCLKTALVLYRLSRRGGHDVDLVFGVRKRAGRLEAHAWVEHAGKVLGSDVAHRQYARLGAWKLDASAA